MDMMAGAAGYALRPKNSANAVKVGGHLLSFCFPPRPNNNAASLHSRIRMCHSSRPARVQCRRRVLSSPFTPSPSRIIVWMTSLTCLNPLDACHRPPSRGRLRAPAEATKRGRKASEHEQWATAGCRCPPPAPTRRAGGRRRAPAAPRERRDILTPPAAAEAEAGAGTSLPRW
jgi:hypothetical protein